MKSWSKNYVVELFINAFQSFAVIIIVVYSSSIFASISISISMCEISEWKHSIISPHRQNRSNRIFHIKIVPLFSCIIEQYQFDVAN